MELESRLQIKKSGCSRVNSEARLFGPLVLLPLHIYCPLIVNGNKFNNSFLF